MRIWLSAVVVTIASCLLKASGPLTIGDRHLPRRMVDVSALIAPALLAGLLMTEIGGAHWAQVNGQQVAGVGVAGVAYLARAPMLVAVLLGVAATALLRLWT